MAAAVTSIAPVVAWPWHLRDMGPTDHTVGASCIQCGRDVAAPPTPCRPVCIYCGMSRGIVRSDDVPIE